MESEEKSLLTIERNTAKGIAACLDCLIKAVHSLPADSRQHVLSVFNRDIAMQSLISHELNTLDADTAFAVSEWGHRVNWPPSTP